MLVLWPPWAHFDIIHGAEGFAYACAQLQKSNTTKPTGDEQSLTDVIMARAKPSDSANVVSSICRVAIQWNDLDLWNRAVVACEAERSIDTLKEENALLALKKFGFKDIHPRYVLLIAMFSKHLVSFFPQSAAYARQGPQQYICSEVLRELSALARQPILVGVVCRSHGVDIGEANRALQHDQATSQCNRQIGSISRVRD